MNLSEPTRAYIYRVLFAAGVVAIAYGLLTAEQVDVWRTLAEAVLVIGGPGQAARNTSTKVPDCVGCDDNGPHGANPELDQ